MKQLPLGNAATNSASVRRLGAGAAGNMACARVTGRGAPVRQPSQCPATMITAARTPALPAQRATRRTRCRTRNVLSAAILQAALAACQLSSHNMASSRASSRSGSGFVLMAQIFQHLFFEPVAKPAQAGFHRLVRLARLIRQVLERPLVHISGLEQLPVLGWYGRKHLA